MTNHREKLENLYLKLEDELKEMENKKSKDVKIDYEFNIRKIKMIELMYKMLLGDWHLQNTDFNHKELRWKITKQLPEK